MDFLIETWGYRALKSAFLSFFEIWRFQTRQWEIQLKTFLWSTVQVSVFPSQILWSWNCHTEHRFVDRDIVFYKYDKSPSSARLGEDNNWSQPNNFHTEEYAHSYDKLSLKYDLFYWLGFRFFCLLWDTFLLLFQTTQKKSDSLPWAYLSDRFFCLDD